MKDNNRYVYEDARISCWENVESVKAKVESERQYLLVEKKRYVLIVVKFKTIKNTHFSISYFFIHSLLQF